LAEQFCGLKKLIFHMKNCFFGSKKSLVGAAGPLRQATGWNFHASRWFVFLARAKHLMDLQVTLNEYCM